MKRMVGAVRFELTTFLTPFIGRPYETLFTVDAMPDNVSTAFSASNPFEASLSDPGSEQLPSYGAS